MRKKGLCQRLSLPLLCAIALVVVGCGSVTVITLPERVSGRLNTFAVNFAPSVAYASALRIVTDLGLQPGIFCSNGPSTSVAPWQAMGQRNTFAQTHRLLVERVSEPADWEGRLLQTPGVLAVLDGVPAYPDSTPEGVGPASITYPCPAPLSAIPTPSAPVPLDGGNAGTYARVTFTAPLTTYDAALYAISNLGLALANPCYDQIAGRATPPPWQSPGQETAFAASPALVVVTTRFITSNQWQTLLRATAGVSAIQAQFTPTC